MSDAGPDPYDVPGRPARGADVEDIWTFACGLLGSPLADRWPDMFASAGVMEMPLVPPGFPLPRRIEGREEIRRIMVPVQRQAFSGRRVEIAVEAFHRASPDLVIVEFTSHIHASDGAVHAVPYVHVVRVLDGEIVLLRDYAPFHLMPPSDAGTELPAGANPAGQP